MNPHVGQVVCNCRYEHLKIVAIDDDGDTVTLENGFTCSYQHCCDSVPHESFEHGVMKSDEEGGYG